MSQDNLKTDMLQAMRRLAKSVTIITTSDGRERFAMSATAVDSLSTEPPSLLICVNKTASLHAALEGGADFCVNILGQEQEHLSHLCSGPVKGEGRFASGDWQTSAGGVPYLADAQATLLCRQDGRFSYGTHTVFIGLIQEIRHTPEITPLIYVNGTYTTAVAMPAPSVAAAS
ncbi:flavin reductase family protein [Pseudomonas panipatensis]|jgi:flavin reductase (DIM6/NTAB) family NADH-FMN oxidoreductase RutF|uniref:NADH-FMN oxidoreductase RutF, flavin reductase (DIM6/NTAB) family n=1 Tax=Pseudomonas panipatensis TaxID=428992 RepID=A0A1G8EN67_9PSED|nr:flavin reductase family protein [Pseudomonas panipatensis]SDH71354.1 NADH-FMN oxidoreductase RutF, flavin reductase (DIM6/NTAB) family [Pseudomonas panipatensis]SMP68468.1 NADH-FMN oxidoreductase RutF, flavin reductase (DIM6/NTAB) family [Pseudomonas panipatensis]